MANVDDLKRNTKKLSEKILTLLAWLFLFLIFFLFNIGLTRKVLSSGKPYLAVVFYFVGVVFAVVLPFVILGMVRATFWWHRTKKDQLLEKQQKIFELFYSEKQGGLGFGLWWSRTVMRRLGGDIIVASEKGKGSTFTLRIPSNLIQN